MGRRRIITIVLVASTDELVTFAAQNFLIMTQTNI